MSRTRMVAAIAMFWTCFERLSSVAAEPDLAIKVSGECPSRGSVIAALQALLPDVTIVDDGAQTSSLVVTSDGSANYVAEIDDVTRPYVDSPTSCESRALKVAVFAFSALAPPVIAKRMRVAAPLAINPASGARRATALAVPANDLVFWFGVGGGFDVAPHAHFDQANRGINLHLAFGESTLQTVIGATFPQNMPTLNTRGVSVFRLPFDLAVRGRLSGGAIAAAVEIGPRFSLVLDTDSPLSRFFEAGLRIAPRLEVTIVQGLAAYLQGQVEYVPWPSSTKDDGREVGPMPSWWAGASLGFAIQIE